MCAYQWPTSLIGNIGKEAMPGDNKRSNIGMAIHMHACRWGRVAMMCVSIVVLQQVRFV